jgi:hypothetical protein
MEASPPASAAFVRGARPALPPVHVVDGVSALPSHWPGYVTGVGTRGSRGCFMASDTIMGPLVGVW